MTIDTTLPPSPNRLARRARSRKAPARWGRRRRLLIPRRRVARVSIPLADLALHELMQDGDIYKIGRTHYLVAPISAALFDALIAAAGATEDEEDGGDAEQGDDDDLGADDFGEPSLGGGDDDLENDGPVTPDADLLDLCGEALHLLSASEKAKVASWALLNADHYDQETRAQRAALWADSEKLVVDAKHVMLRIKKTPAATPAGIYAKALVVRGSVTGAAALAKSLAEDLIACRELRESLWPAPPGLDDSTSGSAAP